MALNIKVRKRKIPNQEDLYYGYSSTSGNVDMDKMVDIISSRSTLSVADIYGVITAFGDLLEESIIDGKSVDLFKMGKFHPKVKTMGTKSITKFTRKRISDYSLKFSINKEFKSKLKHMNVKITRKGAE